MSRRNPDMDAITAILDRADAMRPHWEIIAPGLDRADLFTALGYCHFVRAPLRLRDFVTAPPAEFWDEVANFARHFNRDLPRFLPETFTPIFGA